MTARGIVPEAVLRKQTDASDPAVSAWVTANAGSGKTYVLAQRVIRLLLAGVAPSKILCITFTKAAAANMANRVFDELRKWGTLDDAELDAAIRAMSNIEPSASLRAFARKLFAMALEAPGGLKVQTIHAFCTRLLQQFPFEANVAARFTVLDEAAESQLLDQVSLGVLLEAAQHPDSAYGQALATAMAAVSDQTFKDVVAEAIRKRHIVQAWIAHGGSIETVIGGLCGALGVAAADSLERVDREITEGHIFPSRDWPAAAAIFHTGSSNDQEQAKRLTSAFAATGATRANIYLDVFRTSKGPRQSCMTKGLAQQHPEFARRLSEEQARVIALIERRRAVACRDRTAALITLANAVISRYEAEKERRGLLDYDDLIEKALVLLSEHRAAWVHYKLDRGIDHVLIDEAQDTSPRQWQIIRALVSEFFAGAGARRLKRTIFAVGDEKQSIFSFQGAAPREFDAMRHAFDKLCSGSELEFRHLRFGHSFRSGQNVLDAVDTVFKPDTIRVSLTSDRDGIPPHEALPDAVPGLVEIWDTLKPDPKPAIEAWDAPFDRSSETSPSVRLAQRIARNIARWRSEGVRAGDVLVLVRQRGPLFEAIIRSLKESGIPVAGADRLVLTEHIAVMDLMVLADALLLPDDDLALATVLKSPLFGLDDEALFELAWQRRGSLRGALRANERFAEISARLDRLAAQARLESPFDFFARVLGPERGRARILARLRREADDALDELLNLALDYERRETPSLQGFVNWLRAARTDIKRDMEITRDEVRVMTVHGAKGLEARIVVLADTTTPPAGPPQRHPRLLVLPEERAVPGAPVRFAWAGPKAEDVAVVSAARQAMIAEAEHEYRRLLYVGMTRAIDRLIVCGAEGKNGRPSGCWYNLVSEALKPLSEKADDGEGEVWRYRKHASHSEKAVKPAKVASTAGAGLPVAPILPEWLLTAVCPEPATVAPLSPSKAYDERTTTRLAKGSGLERHKALDRGTLMHRLLQALPGIPPVARAEAARNHFARAAPDLSAAEGEAMLAEVFRVLDDPSFGELFAPGSRSEVPIVGRLTAANREILVSGQVDRLLVTPRSLLIADYKTNSPAPRRLQDVPRAYIAQLSLYRAVLTELYPGRNIRAALVWTEIPALMEVPAPALDAELARLTSL